MVRGGRALRMPLFELVDSVDLTNIAIDIEVKGAYSKGGIPLNVHGVANIKLPGEEPLLNNAIERFLGRSRARRSCAIAKETLEGNLRGVLAQLTPEEVNQDKTRFAQTPARGGRARPEPHGPRARHPEDPEHHRRRRLPELHRPHPGRARAHGRRHRRGQGHRRRRAQQALNWCASEIAKVDADLAIAQQETQKRIAGRADPPRRP